MTITVNEFKTLGGSLLERVRTLREEVSIMEAGIVVARLIPEMSAAAKPWHQLRGSVAIRGDLTEPIMEDDEVSSSLQAESEILSASNGH